MIPLLLSFGLDEFSVSPSAVPETRKQIAGWSRAKADRVTESAMELDTAGAVEQFLAEHVKA